MMIDLIALTFHAAALLAGVVTVFSMAALVRSELAHSVQPEGLVAGVSVEHSD
jgi:hypothetical protein